MLLYTTRISSWEFFLTTTEFAEFGVFLIKNSLLRASAVTSLLDRDNQNSHWEICASRENFHG
jgi:hypothetical protein